MSAPEDDSSIANTSNALGSTTSSTESSNSNNTSSSEASRISSVPLKMIMWVSKSRTKVKRNRVGVIRKAVIALIQQEGIEDFLDRTPTMESLSAAKEASINMTVEQSAMEALLCIAQDPLVVEAVGKWWDHTAKNDRKEVTKDTYLSIHLSTYFALLSGSSRLEAKKVAEEEWKLDCEGKTTLDQQRFFKAVFELADVWCETRLPKEFVLAIYFFFV